MKVSERDYDRVQCVAVCIAALCATFATAYPNSPENIWAAIIATGTAGISVAFYIHRHH